MSPDTEIQRAANSLEAGRVRRYHAAPTVEAQTVGLHSWGVALLCLYITGGNASRELLAQAILHDTAELVTGDIPFTVKRDRVDVKKVFDELEACAHANWVMPSFVLSPHDAAVLKLCDTLEGLIWCRKTELTGPVRERWLNALYRALDKFAPFISPTEHQRAMAFVNDNWPSNL